jgi:hypothetical protein
MPGIATLQRGVTASPPHGQHVAGAKGPSFETAESRPRRGRTTSKHDRNIDAAVDRDVCAQAIALARKRQCRPHANLNRTPHLDRASVNARPEVGSGDRNQAWLAESDLGTDQRHFKAGGCIGVPHESIGRAKRKAIHRA